MDLAGLHEGSEKCRQWHDSGHHAAGCGALWQQVALLMPFIVVLCNDWVCCCLVGMLVEGTGLDGTHECCDNF